MSILSVTNGTSTTSINGTPPTSINETPPTSINETPPISINETPPTSGLTKDQIAVLDMCDRDPENPFLIQPLTLIVDGISHEKDLRNAILNFINCNAFFRLRVKYNDAEELECSTAVENFSDIEVEDLRDVEPDELDSEIHWIILDEKEHGIDISRDYPLRVRLLHIGEEKWVILLMLHRLIYHRREKLKFIDALCNSLDSVLSSKTSWTDLKGTPDHGNKGDFHGKESLQNTYKNFESLNKLKFKRPKEVSFLINECGSICRELPDLSPVLNDVMEKFHVSPLNIMLSSVLLWSKIFQPFDEPDFFCDLSFGFKTDGQVQSQTPLACKTLINDDFSFFSTIKDWVLNQEIYNTGVHKDWKKENTEAYKDWEGKNSETHKDWEKENASILCRFYDLETINSHDKDYSIHWYDGDIDSTEYDIEWIFKSSSSSIDVILVYNSALAGFAEAESLMEDFVSVFNGMLNNFEETISSVIETMARERVSGFKEQTISLPPWKMRTISESENINSLGQMFSLVAAKYPENIAIRTPESAISYKELDDLTDNIAHALSHYAGMGGRIGIALDQGINAIAAILSVLKSGNAYVPLDISMPLQRLSEMINDADLALLVTKSYFDGLENVLSDLKVNIIYWDDMVKGEDNIKDDFDGKPKKFNDICAASANDDAYIIYTSGSTGSPKGVVQIHKNVLHYIEAYSRRLDISPSDCLTLISYYFFDAAVVDIFSALLNGATLIVCDLKKESFAAISERIQYSNVTVFHSTPSVFRYFIDSLEPGVQFESVRYVVLGGEQARKEDLTSLTRHFANDACLVNLYGLSEATIVSMGFFNAGMEVNDGVLPIGEPIESFLVSIRNEDGIETPGRGEIVLSAPCLAKEYWNRQDLTFAKFKKNSKNPALRGFFTGDIGKITSSGALQHMGRLDFQIKIRGYRVEAGEIESRIVQFKGVKKCLVHPISGADGGISLAAFIILNNDSQGINMDELRKYLIEFLPGYMIPEKFVHLDSFPHTHTGKINRRKLEELSVL
ncbi:amino acid adenylation domain-containing protein [Desulfamplus magnetovallimortis]|nr:amino acid adenylation domain-containing protein [Desulfamplus magnetovallimortis]